MTRRRWPWGYGLTTGYYRFYYRLLPVGFQTGSREISSNEKTFCLPTTGTTSTPEIVPFLTGATFSLQHSTREKIQYMGLVYTNQKPVVPAVTL
jgi:hypothetical protein